MHFLFDTTSIHARFFLIVLVFGLLLSFSLHSIQIIHTHYGEHNEHMSGQVTLGEYMHTTDKKIFFIGMSFSMLLWSFLDNAFLAWRGMLQFAVRRCVSITEATFERYQLFNYYNLFFKKGILHSKAY